MASGDTGIRNEGYMRQIKEFSGLRFGSITPTDIDCFFDFSDGLFIFVELKHGDTKLPFGQKLALERLCDACESGGKKSCLIVARHDCPQDENIDVSLAVVSDVRWERKWRPWRDKNDTVRDLVEKVRDWWMKDAR